MSEQPKSIVRFRGDDNADGTAAWHRQDDPLRAAVEYLAAASPAFNWVGIYLLNGDTLELGPFIGAATDHTRIKVGVGVCGTAVARNTDMNVPDVSASDNYLACSVDTRSELVVLIRDPSGAIVGQIDIDSHRPAAFGPDEERMVREVAAELGRGWATPGLEPVAPADAASLNSRLDRRRSEEDRDVD